MLLKRLRDTMARAESIEDPLGEVVRRMEPEMDIVPCMDRDNHSCVISEVCGMKPVFHEAREAFLRVLDGYSVADITRNRLSLLRLLPAA